MSVILSKRYSVAFKQEVVQAVESGRMSVKQAHKHYQVGTTSINRWRIQIGTQPHKRIFIQSLNEPDLMTTLQDQNKTLEAEKRQLESALAQAHIKNLLLEAELALYKQDGQAPTEKKNIPSSKKPWHSKS